MQAYSWATKRLRQQNQQLKDSLGYVVKLSKQNKIRRESEGERRGGRGRREREGEGGQEGKREGKVEKQQRVK